MQRDTARSFRISPGSSVAHRDALRRVRIRLIARQRGLDHDVLRARSWPALDRAIRARPGCQGESHSVTAGWVRGCRSLLGVPSTRLESAGGASISDQPSGKAAKSRLVFLYHPIHLLQGTFVRCVTLSDHFLEMSILRFYDLICGHAMVRKIARATQLLTRHGLHEARFPFTVSDRHLNATKSVRMNISGFHPSTDHKRIAKSPPRAAVRYSSTTWRLSCAACAATGSGTPCTLRRALLASWRTAVPERPMTALISWNG